MIEQAHKVFLHHLTDAENPAIVEQAFGFGMLVGSYLDGKDRDREAHRLRQSVNGHNSGKVRSEEAEQRWQHHALELGLEGRRKNWKRSLPDYISTHWRLPPDTCPGHESLKKFVTKKIKSGELAPKTLKVTPSHKRRPPKFG